MKLEDADLGIVIDDEFPCSSAGEMRVLVSGVYGNRVSAAWCLILAVTPSYGHTNN